VGKQSRFDPLTGKRALTKRGGAPEGVWRRNGRKAKRVNQGDLSAAGAGVDAAGKRRNPGGQESERP
jgi:hypothetical protein